MRRVHLVEILDLPWVPAALRDAATDYLAFMGNLSEKPYAAFVERLATAMGSDRRVVSLCSGAGGPLPTLTRMLRARGVEPEVTLTDLWPRPGTERVDARAVPAHLGGLRFVCNAFHHFEPADARAILADAVARREKVVVVEVAERSVPAVLNILFAPLLQLFVVPFIRPFRLSRVLLTYVLPLLPAVTVFDGVVSCLRVYDPDELRELVSGLDGYAWDIGRLPIAGTPFGLTYLVGTPA